MFARIANQIKLGSLGLLLASMLAVFLVMQYSAQPKLERSAQELAQTHLEASAQQLTAQLNRYASLTQSLAALAETLPLEQEVFMAYFPNLINQFGDSRIAGGGIWPEPNAFDSDKQKFSFFWARNASGQLEFLDDYNQASASPYHNEGWYSVAKGLKAGQCAWSEAYEDPASKAQMVTCSVAIKRQGRFFGVATVDVLLSGLNQFALDMGKKSSGLCGLTGPERPNCQPAQYSPTGL